MPDLPPRQPAWNPAAHPVKLRCPEGSHRVFGWVYPDGTIELPCRQKHEQDRPGCETRHLFNPETGDAFPVYVEKPKQ